MADKKIISIAEVEPFQISGLFNVEADVNGTFGNLDIQTEKTVVFEYVSIRVFSKNPKLLNSKINFTLSGHWKNKNHYIDLGMCEPIGFGSGHFICHLSKEFKMLADVSENQKLRLDFNRNDSGYPVNVKHTFVGYLTDV